MSRRPGRKELCAALVLAAFLGGACSRPDPAPDVSAVVEGVEIPAAATEALLEGHVKAESTHRESADGHGIDTDRKDSLTNFVLLYQIKHAVLRHLAREMGVSVEGGGNPEAEAGRLSHAMAERLFPEIAAPDDAPPERAAEFTDARRQSLFSDWFDKQLRLADVRVDEHFGHWDAERGVVVQ